MQESSSLLDRAPLREMLVGVVVLAAAFTSILLTRVPGGIALFWAPNALAAALLIRLPRIRWGSAALAVLVPIFLANVLAADRTWPIAAAFTGINMLEITMMVGVFRFGWVFPYPKITVGQASIMTAIFGLAIPAVAALAGGLLLHRQFATPFFVGTLQWWVSHALGACLLGPPFILFSFKELKRLVQKQFLLQNALLLIGSLAGCYLAIRFVKFPFVLMSLFLLLTAFRVGGFGTALRSLCFALMISGLWLKGIRPLGLNPAEATSNSLADLPFIALLATTLPPIAVGLGSDARRAAARALRSSERRFRDSMEHSPIGMLIADTDGIWTYANIALQEMLGYSAEEFRRLPPGGPSTAEDWKASEPRWRRLIAGEIDFYDVSRRFQHKDGHWVWTHVAVSLLRDDEGEPMHLIAQIESLEARQRAEEKLAEERERFKITLESISEAVITADADTLITYMNPAAESLLGLNFEAIGHRRIDQIVHLTDPHTSKSATSLIGQCTLQAKMVRREQPCLLHRPDGSIFYVTDVVSPIFDTAGQVSGLVVVLHDSTRDMERAIDLQRRATHDPLTGLANRAEFEQQLRRVLVKAHKLELSAALMAIDLDRFKAVNDTAGHAAGDAVLTKVAEMCRGAVRSSDTVARLGGDEFAILLDNCGEERARAIGQQMLGLLNPLQVEWEGAHYSIGASIGLAMSAGVIGDEQAWLRAADQACYVAKQRGRGQIQFASHRSEQV